MFLYGEKLKTSREATLKYKEENGIMRKKFTVLQKEMEDQKIIFSWRSGAWWTTERRQGSVLPARFPRHPSGE